MDPMARMADICEAYPIAYKPVRISSRVVATARKTISHCLIVEKTKAGGKSRGSDP